MVYIDKDLCTGFGLCQDVCPESAITVVNVKAWIDRDKCSECDRCRDACPQGAIGIAELLQPEYLPLVPAADQTHWSGLLNPTLRAVGSMLSSTGRELLPRLASVGLGLLEYRLTKSAPVHAEPTGVSAAETRPRWMASGHGLGRRRRRRGRQRSNSRLS